ncbi:uncharacterized protein KIAA2013 homolog [Asterias rubens]|uniref:uncharacterized protein KIAA2013 homolog n=1 Tax=Asterias rubens TaxID=7604 RepID=UPI001454ED0C|nr:uncharacterized protein KIAA2013 homolog [Asterias rubens]
MGLATLLKRLSAMASNPRSRKIIFLAVAALVCFGYIGPWVIHHNQTVKVTTGCLTLKLKELESEMSEVEASIYQADKHEGSADRVIPFVGNGNIGLVANVLKANGIMVRNEESWINIGFYRPLVRAKLIGLKDQSATVLHYKKAQVQRYQCYSVEESCVLVKTNTLVHRVMPSVMLQEIIVENDADQPVTLELARNGPHKWKGSASTMEMYTVNGKTREYVLSAGDVTISNPAGGSRVIVLVIAASVLEKKIVVPSKSVHREHVLTIVKYSDPVGSSSPQLSAHLVDEANDEFFKLLHRDFSELIQEHESTWTQQIWNTGLVQEPLAIPLNPRVDTEVQRQLSHIAAVHLFNILTTAVMYYMMSSIQAPLLTPSVPIQRKKEVIMALQQPGSCFSGQPTLFEDSLWQPVNTEKELADLLSHWQHVLYKHGCHSLLSVGVTGIMQAMMLSFLAGQFTERELSFHADPLLFRNKFHLHNIFYNTSFLHIDINPNPGEQGIFISTTSIQAKGVTPIKLYACGTGCEGTPILLTASMQQIPLKWTEPQTPFLYISHDVKHLAYLKQKIIHFKHLYELDGAAVNALMPVIIDNKDKQGFQMPVIVWVIIIVCILIFHMFLLNLVYREYCSGSSGVKLSEKTSRA